MKELTKKQKIILLKGDIQIWIDEEKANDFILKIEEYNYDDVLKYEGRAFTKAMVQGIFLPDDITEQTNRKNGQWKCKGLNWHDRGERCECASQEEKKLLKARMEAIEACGKCDSGWIKTDQNTVRQCECTKNLTK